MTHRPETVASVLVAANEGLNASEIARSFGLPRATVRDWLAGKAPRFGPTDESCVACGRAAHDFEALPQEYSYLLGLYLGDGCLSEHRRSVYKLRIALDEKYPQIIDEAVDAIAKVMPANTVGRCTKKGCVEVYSYSKSWPCLFPQHGLGKKHNRAIVLEDWQLDIVTRNPEPLLRGLIQSDGCRFMNTGKNWQHPRYSFTNLSADIREIFTDACDLLGLRWTAAKVTIYVSRKADVARMDEFIGPKA